MWFRTLAELDRDFRYGLRQLISQRGSSVVAVLTLALGIGASTAIFSVIDATILRQLAARGRRKGAIRACSSSPSFR